MRTLLAQWRWRIQRRLGLAQLLSLVMLCACAVLAIWISSLQNDNEVLRTQIMSKSHRVTPVAEKDAEPKRATVGAQVGEFVSAFPVTGQSTDDLETIFRSAERHGVRLVRGEYQFKQDSNDPLLTLQATFPIKSDYQHIKDFTTDVLKTLPHVAMEDLRMARSDASTPTLDALVRFNMVYRRP